jgi:hypothetical protein
MNTRILILGMILVAAILSDCEKDNDHPCPLCDQDITWDSYGDWTLQDEGGDGNSSNTGSTQDPVNLIMDCGWRIHGNSTGGTGKIYAAFSCDTTVIFVWTWSSFTLFRVDERWAGQTEEGIRMGDSMDKFLATYPDFKPSWYVSPDIFFLEYEQGDRYVEATFSKEKKLIHLYVRKD